MKNIKLAIPTERSRLSYELRRRGGHHDNQTNLWFLPNTNKNREYVDQVLPDLVVKLAEGEIPLIHIAILCAESEVAEEIQNYLKQIPETKAMVYRSWIQLHKEVKTAEIQVVLHFAPIEVDQAIETTHWLRKKHPHVHFRMLAFKDGGLLEPVWKQTVNAVVYHVLNQRAVTSIKEER